MSIGSAQYPTPFHMELDETGIPDSFGSKSEQQRLAEWELEHLAVAIKFISEQVALMGGGPSTGAAKGSTSLMPACNYQEMLDEKFRANVEFDIGGDSVSSFGSKRSFKCRSRGGSNGVTAFFSHPEHHKHHQFADGLEGFSRTSSNSSPSRTGSSSSSVFRHVYPWNNNSTNNNSRPASPVGLAQHGNRRFYKPPMHLSPTNSDDEAQHGNRRFCKPPIHSSSEEDDAGSAAEPSSSENSMGRGSDKSFASARNVPIDNAGSTHRHSEDDRASNDSGCGSPSISLKYMDSERGRPLSLPVAASSSWGSSGSSRLHVGSPLHKSAMHSPQHDRASRVDARTTCPIPSSFGAAEYSYRKGSISPDMRALRTGSPCSMSRESSQVENWRASSSGRISPILREAAQLTRENSNNSLGGRKVMKAAPPSLETWIFRTASNAQSGGDRRESLRGGGSVPSSPFFSMSAGSLPRREVDKERHRSLGQEELQASTGRLER